MSDPQREQASAPGEPAGVTRDARIEELLLTGLDHYFASRYNEAINVWTRVLFLDRAHARARAYIERARSAIAERQRECDELLQRGVAAFHDGRADLARGLLTRAAERTGSQQEEALAMLARIERLEAAALADASLRAPRRRRHDEPGASIEGGRPFVWLAFVVVVAALAAIAALAATRAGHTPSWLALLPTEAREPAVVAPASLPPPQPGDVAIRRARALFVRGRLNEALKVLDEVPRGDRTTAEADALRADIQKLLLDAAGARPMSPSAPLPAGGGQ
ncbi:MAG TPA: hypothetical protein VK886_17210 [Vicinamibacterales bacterium]|nr:hypothetical protein [Vicinamibacterales bacterium]